MISLQPKKLLLSKWTAVKPLAKEKHFLVTKVVSPEFEGGKVEWIDLEAVHSKSIRRMEWKELRDSTQWVGDGSRIFRGTRICPGRPCRINSNWPLKVPAINSP
jgi:tryptophan-rich hypothetical protein